jgi:hypothetical protein
MNDPQELVEAVPRLQLVADVPFLNLPELVDRLSTTRFRRWTHRALGRRQFWKKMVRHLRYRF